MGTVRKIIRHEQVPPNKGGRPKKSAPPQRYYGNNPISEEQYQINKKYIAELKRSFL
jgi:hypothetical protein